MPQNPPSQKNRHIKRVKFIFDLSNNNASNISTTKKYNNNDLFPFQNCKELKNITYNYTPSYNKSYKQKNLNRKLDHFKMKMDTILEQIRKEREDNTKKNSTITHYKQFIKTLDDISNNKNSINKYTSPTNSKETLDILLNNINNKYNSLDSKLLIPKLLEDKSTSTKNYIIPKDLFETTHYRNNQPFTSSSLTSSSFIPVPIPAPIMLRLPQLKSTISAPPKIIRKITIDREINNLNDILKLIDDFPLEEDIEYNINMEAIHNIKNPLCELNNMIGVKELKNNIVDQVIYFMQDFHTVQKKNQDFMHTVIYGPPGTGKTEIAKIIGKIFCNMGVLSRNIFKKVTRSDLIAGYLGQTAIKTRDVMRNCMGGVLFIDEAYALGNSEKRDSFAKECIDTLCEGLSDNKENLMVIIAGYEEDLKKCFFAYNQGLDSRFPWRFKTDDYDAHDLNLIFQKKIKDAGWSLKASLEDKWFKDNMDYFKYYGRDMETLFSKTKMAHSRRVFCKKQEDKTILTKTDLEKGLQMFLSNGEVQSRKGNINDEAVKFMYM